LLAQLAIRRSSDCLFMLHSSASDPAHIHSFPTRRSSDLGCDGGEWKVIGGDIVADNGTSIEVVWNHVGPEDGFGYVSYRSNCSCPAWTTVKIPVLLHRGIIKKPGVVCEGSQGRFTLPQWPATEFEWMINGDPYHPMLVHTDQRNEIVVDGAVPGDYVLSVNYRNTLIDDGKCMGKAEIKFSVAE